MKNSIKKSYKKYCITYLSNTKKYIKVDDQVFYDYSKACSHLYIVKELLQKGDLYLKVSKEVQKELSEKLIICEQTFVEKVTWTNLHPTKI